MSLPRPYFLRRTPGPDTFNKARALVKHLLATAPGPQTTRALFAAGTRLDAIPGSGTPLRRVVDDAKAKKGEEKDGQHVVRSLSYLKAVIHDLKTRNQIEQVQIPSPHTHRKHIFAWQPFTPRVSVTPPAKKPKAPWLPSALAAIRLGGDLTHLNRRKRRKALAEVRVGALRLHSQADLERREREVAESERRRAERKAAKLVVPLTADVSAVEARA
ncbi:hypothetical protein PENSPDRAFT_751251 [Peniophora sp. CONT]|nr:hypothetical protein PENSPDRAFT_751251 [Peniophora sp. CONT]